VRSLRITLAFTSVLFVALAGCKPEDEIAKETVTHADREKIRLRVAVIERPRHVYFFRLSGPIELINQNEAAFNDFVRSATFVGNKKPTWTEPKGWKKDPPMDAAIGGLDTLARFRLDAKPKEIEIAVTRMPSKGFNLMTNMHRWQKQVNVALTESHDELKEQVKEKDGIKWVDLTGLAVHTVSKPAEPVAAKKVKDLIPVAGMIPFEYVKPEKWVRMKPREMAPEVLRVTNDEEEVAEITFVRLPGGGGGLAGNINRWRKEIKLPELPDAEAENAAARWEVAGAKAHFVDLDNPKGPEERNRTLGVILPMGDATWFIKMSGPGDLVGENRKEFEGFVKSLKRK
jgi:hypothetical protein